MIIYVISVFLSFVLCFGHEAVHHLYEDLDLPSSHYSYYFRSHPDEVQKCKINSACPYKEYLDHDVCWGYEDECHPQDIPVCTALHKQWAADLKAQSTLFWETVDFGYVKGLIPNIEICQPMKKNRSYLICSKMFCKAHNIIISFTKLYNNEGEEYKRLYDDLFGIREIGGDCNMIKQDIPPSWHVDKQSWIKELSNFKSMNFTKKECDVIESPSFFMKMESGVNMYHRFCDFVNLYLSQHLAAIFRKDVNIIRWETRDIGYIDDFNFTLNAFTKNPVVPLKKWKNKSVCFKDAIFVVPSRTVRGFYHNMPVVPGCHGSRFINAFSQHVLHRLRIESKRENIEMLQVTLIERRTKHRNIVNQDELVAALVKRPSLNVNVVHFSRDLSLKDQLTLIQSTDILIGIHGAGLTHILFLPNQAVVFELYNCNDKSYLHLSQLRGIYYITWEDETKLQKLNETLHPSLGKEHPKFCDYHFDVIEFQKIFKQAENYVRSHRPFKARVEL